jgi:hypothetical protein
MTDTAKSEDMSLVSDGYHTFGELYAHRIELFIALCRVMNRLKQHVWKSRLHSDGSAIDDWFVLGIGIHSGHQITYHLPEHKWGECSFAHTMERAPEFDGHTASDVLERLKTL